MLEKELVPQLRFSEFDGEWNSSRLGNLGEFKGGGTPTTDNSEYWNGNIPWISSSDVKENDILNLNVTRYLSKKAIEESATKIIPEGSILFVSRVGVGKLTVSEVKLCTSQDFANLSPKKDSSYYIAYYFLSKNKLLHQYAQGTSIKGFTMGDLKSIPINIPSLPEQQKIAAFLTEVDAKLSQLTKKKVLLENYKKGVMQQIFSQEIRFKHNNSTKFGTREVSEFPDWEEKKLGSLCNKAQSGGTPKSTKKEFYNGDIPFLAISDMTYQGKYLTKTSKTISKLGLDNSSSWLVPKDSLIYSMYASVGFVSINKIEISTSQAVMNIMLKDSVLTEYMYYFLLDFKRYVSQFIETGTQGNINASIVKNFDIKVPSLKEQTKIANFLSELDSKIEVLSITIENTETFKKGLLQQMFV